MSSWLDDFEIVDSEFNKLIYKNKRLYIKLGNHTRKIGEIKFYNSKMYYGKTNLIESKHLMRKNNSWGICYELLKILPDDSIIVVRSDKDTYLINAQTAKEKGRFLWFKKEGFERQIFIEKKYWGKRC